MPMTRKLGNLCKSRRWRETSLGIQPARLTVIYINHCCNIYFGISIRKSSLVHGTREDFRENYIFIYYHTVLEPCLQLVAEASASHLD